MLLRAWLNPSAERKRHLWTNQNESHLHFPFLVPDSHVVTYFAKRKFFLLILQSNSGVKLHSSHVPFKRHSASVNPIAEFSAMLSHPTFLIETFRFCTRVRDFSTSTRLFISQSTRTSDDHLCHQLSAVTQQERETVLGSRPFWNFKAVPNPVL